MKQVILFLAAGIFWCSCNTDEVVTKSDAAQMKFKLLKQAGFDKMGKSFRFDYAEQNDSVVATLSLTPENGIIDFNEADSAKGILLNVFNAPNGNAYSTRLMKRGGVFEVGTVVIDGNEVPVTTVVITETGAGNPPPNLCGGDNCSPECLQNCSRYITSSILPGLQHRADSTCRAVVTCFSCPYGSYHPCYYIIYAVFPNSRYCGSSLHDPHNIAIQKLSGGIIVKNNAVAKDNVNSSSK